MSSAASASGSSDGRRGGSDAAAVAVAVRSGEEAARVQYGLAMEFLKGENGVEQDLEKGADMLKAAAFGGLVEAQMELGKAYYDSSYGFSQDFAEVVKWFRRAADQGDAAGQDWLGVCYRRGLGVDKDLGEAARLYRLSAEQGHAGGQFNFGYCYRLGVGVDRDHEEGARWIRLAADQGHAQAQANLGWCYQHGKGVQQDYAEAARFFQLAADQDGKVAQKYLGLLYFQGHGVQRNCDTALHWLRLSGKTDRATTNAIAEIERSAQELLNKQTETQLTMIEAGESVFGQAQDGTGDFALHVAARQMHAETVALLFDHPSFDDLVQRANAAGELPRDVVSHGNPRKVESREARALRSVLSVSRRTRSACVLWCFEVLRDVAPERLLACIPRDIVREIVQHIFPRAPPGSLLCGVATLLYSPVAWPRPCRAIAPPVVPQPTTPQDVLALQQQQQTAVAVPPQQQQTAAILQPPLPQQPQPQQQQQQAAVVLPIQQRQQTGPGAAVQGADQCTSERGSKRTLGESASTVDDAQSGAESDADDLEPANKRSRS